MCQLLVEERTENSDKFYGMQETSLVHPGPVKGREDNQTDTRPSSSGEGTF